MSINYQVMKENRKRKTYSPMFGWRDEYLPDYEALIANAKDEAEADYIREVQKSGTTFAFNMVYVQKQNCGHYEIFQTPCNEYYTLAENLSVAKEHSRESCTHCVCNRLSRVGANNRKGG